MAIVENRSTETGDILRIKTDVPMVGIVSLFSFLDDTEGENISSGGNFVNPDMGGRRRNNLSWGAKNSNEYYFDVYTQDELNTLTEIIKLNYSGGSSTWEPVLNLDGYRSIVALEYSNNYLYCSVSVDSSGDWILLEIDLSDNSIREIIQQLSSNVLLYGGISVDYSNSLMYCFGKNSSTGDIGIFEINFSTNSIENFYEFNSYLDKIYSSFSKIGFDESSGDIFFSATTSSDIIFEKFNINSKTFTQTIGFVNNGYNEIFSSLYTPYGIYYNNDVIYFLKKPSVLGSINNEFISLDLSNSLNTQVVLATPPNNNLTPSFIQGDNIFFYDRTTGQYTYYYSITSNEFLELTESGSSDKYFTKQFRYSIDGGNNFSEWLNLSSVNLSNLNINRKDLFVIEYKYQRSGLDNTGTLTWNSTTLQGTINPLENPIYNRSVFKKFFEVNDVNVLSWALNVLEKLYKKGIIPEYVTRGESEYNPIEEDVDFLNFFNVTTHFFAIIVYYARQFRDLRGNALLTREFILSKGLTIPFDENLEDMVYIFDNYVDEYRKRGTYSIINKKDDGYDIDGELMRLINYLNDEFIFGLLAPKDLGWCVGESSPMWSLCKRIKNLIKGYEFAQSVEDLSKYPLLNDSYIDIFDDSGLNVMRLSGFQSSGLNTGISQSDLSSPNSDYLIKIDPSLDYEISFKIKKTTSDPIELSFNLHGYDTNLSKVSLTNIQSGFDSNSFITSSIDLKIDSVYYSFRGVLFNYNESLNTVVPFFENGANLRSKSNIKYILPEIVVSDSSSDVYIYDIKILPLNLPYTQGQLGIKNVIMSFLKNNGGLSDEEVENFIERYLIPYDYCLTTKFIN